MQHGQGRVDEAIAVLRPQVNADNWDAAAELAKLLASQGRVDDAVALVRPRADAGDWRAVTEPVELLASQGRVDDVIAFLRPRADAGNSPFRERTGETAGRPGAGG